MSNKEWLTQIIKKDAPNLKYDVTEEEATNLKSIYNDFVKRRKKLKKVAKTFKMKFADIIQIKNDYFVRFRVKDAGHLIIKILREEDKIRKLLTVSNYLSYFKDLIGFRVLCVNQADKLIYLKQFNNIVRNIEEIKFYTSNLERKKEYLIEKEKYEKNTKCELEFRNEPTPYESIHVYTKSLNKDVMIEFQIRTLFEEAWGEVDHTLKYPYNMDDDVIKEQMSILFSVSEVADKIITSAFNRKNDKNNK